MPLLYIESCRFYPAFVALCRAEFACHVTNDIYRILFTPSTFRPKAKSRKVEVFDLTIVKTLSTFQRHVCIEK